jgi:hypothetical protein
MQGVLPEKLCVPLRPQRLCVEKIKTAFFN